MHIHCFIRITFKSNFNILIPFNCSSVLLRFHFNSFFFSVFNSVFIRILFKFYLHYGLIPIKFYLRHVLQNVYQRACRLLRARTALHKPPATKRSAHIRTASRAPKRVPTRFLVCFRMCSALRNVYLHACFFLMCFECAPRSTIKLPARILSTSEM